MFRLDEVIGLVTKPPRSSKPVIELNRDAFLLPNGLLYDYYSIKLKPISLGDKFVRIEKSPPVLADGIIIFNKKAYNITKRDLLRRKFNVSTERTISNNTESTSTAENVTPTANVKRGPSESLGVEISEDADVAWTEQVQTLLYADNTQTWDWETETVAQPGLDDEDGTVPNLD